LVSNAVIYKSHVLKYESGRYFSSGRIEKITILSS
jgi:hypothetical protein